VGTHEEHDMLTEREKKAARSASWFGLELGVVTKAGRTLV
jgi:hypothetical protein